jgi:alpha-D-ribose 1-methylphosphonate 5-triphosphate synthase subunit PhnG
MPSLLPGHLRVRDAHDNRATVEPSRAKNKSRGDSPPARPTSFNCHQSPLQVSRGLEGMRGIVIKASDPERTERQRWMAVLARASRAEIETRLASVAPLPSYEVMTPATIGTVMVEGRAGGTGSRFNLGEATLTKAVVRLSDGTMGFSYALGRDTIKALLSAVLDAALQDANRRSELMRTIVEPLAEAQRARRLQASRIAAATKVQFFTLQRGDG